MADGSLVQTWMYDDYESSGDPNFATGDGTISDGGDDMYDNGNHLTTSRCSADAGISPYTTGMTVVDSDCFGPGGQYRMDLRESMMVVVAKGAAPASTIPPWDFTVTGNLGADGNGIANQYDNIPARSGLKAYAKTVCSGTDPSVVHLMVVEDDPTAYQHVLHTIHQNTDDDYDELRNIP